MLKYSLALDKVKMTLYSHTVQRRDLNGDFRANYLERLLKTHVLCKDQMSFGISTYKYQYTFREIGTEEGVIWLGIWNNQPKAIGEQNRMIQLEWNPQKTKIPGVIKEWLFFEEARYSEINKCDFAFDFENVYPHDIRYFTKGNTMTWNGNTNYLHPKADHLRIKIYDKTKERTEKGKNENMEQTTRIEITLKKPKLCDREQDEIMGTEDWEYMQEVTRALAEVFIPAEMKTRIDHLEEKYGEYDQAMLYALRQLNHDQQVNALKLMAKERATKYRAALKAGDVESLNIDELALADAITKALRREIEQLTPPPDYWAKYRWYPPKEESTETQLYGEDLTDEERLQCWYELRQKAREQAKQENTRLRAERHQGRNLKR